MKWFCNAVLGNKEAMHSSIFFHENSETSSFYLCPLCLGTVWLVRDKGEIAESMPSLDLTNHIKVEEKQSGKCPQIIRSSNNLLQSLILEIQAKVWSVLFQNWVTLQYKQNETSARMFPFHYVGEMCSRCLQSVGNKQQCDGLDGYWNDASKWSKE